jgi:ribonuclease P protein component
VPRHRLTGRSAAFAVSGGFGVSSVALVTLKRRAEFLRLRGGSRWASASAVIEMKARTGPPAEGFGVAPRFGFTVTKALGNAVTRNRIRRRLKAAITALVTDGRARAGCDYVVIARAAALTQPFAEIVAELGRALDRVNTGKPRRDRPKSP